MGSPGRVLDHIHKGCASNRELIPVDTSISNIALSPAEQLEQFHFLFNDDDLVRVFPLAENSGWPTPLCQGYEYRVPADITLGVFIQILATTILCGINEPSLGKGQRTVVDGFPKRGAPPGLDKKALTAGLGFHVSRGFSLKKIAIWMFSLAIVGFLFVPAWLALVDKHDLQNAFTPFTILYIPCGIALAIIPQLL